jgi:hypothetical protein
MIFFLGAEDVDSTCRRWASTGIGLLGILALAQGVQQFPVGSDQVGGVARAQPGVAPGM